MHELVAVCLDPGPVRAGHELVVAVRYWASSFKYGEFAYHVVGMDAGAFLLCLELALHACGVSCCTTRLAVSDEETRTAMGIGSPREDVYATVSLGEPVRLSPGLSLTAEASERSQRVITFPQMTEVLDEHLAGASLERRFDFAGLPLRDVDQALDSRHSAFGRFVPSPIPGKAFAMLGRCAQCLVDDLSDSMGMSAVALYALVSTVTGLEPAIYRFDRERRAWLWCADPVPTEDLQAAYFLDNYDMGLVGAAVIPVVETSVVYSVETNGYRSLNAQIGALSQAIYLLAEDLGIGCGAVLGFDNVKVGEWVLGRRPEGLEDRWPYLLLNLGMERQPVQRFRARLAWGEEL